ncbi:MAG: pilus assembly FimT family protein [Mariniblastus sp.]
MKKKLQNDAFVQLRNRCAGMTLMELLLVVAIMVVVTAVAAPTVQQTLANQSLKKSADRVRVAMGQARVRAIKNGEEYAVFISPGGSYFSVAPFRTFEQQGALAGQRERDLAEGRASSFEDDLLPVGILFVAAESAMDARGADILSTSGSKGALEPIFFYPDGTSQDAIITLQNQKQATIEVHLRGLTGIAKTVRPDFVEAEGVQ